MEGWELLKIKGIPLRVHPSWFFILVLFTWTAKGQLANALTDPLPAWMIWGSSFATSLLLFCSVVLHELGHSLVALNEGVKVRSITLFLLGGFARVERECPTPMGSLRIAAAGPLVSLILGVILLKTGQSLENKSFLLNNLFSQLGSLNLVLAFFNLIPGLPLDGGLILKALVWQFTGSHKKGLQVANASGRGLSLLAIVLGVWLFFKGIGLSGFWLVMLGWFGLTASRSQTQILEIQSILTELKVGKASGRRFRVLEADQPLRKLSDLRISETTNQGIPDWILICSSGRWIGYITDEPLKELPVQNWDRYSLLDFIKPLSELPGIGEKAQLWEAILAIEKSKNGRLLVFNIAGLPSGTIDRLDIGVAVLKRLGLKQLPKSILDIARTQNTYPLGLTLPQIVEAMLSSRIVDDLADSKSIK